MRVLLDECVDRRLARELSGIDVTTVPQMGWAGIRNGELLELAGKQFDAFLTVDRNLAVQQHQPHLPITVVIIRARTNRLRDLLPLVPRILHSLRAAKVGEIIWVGEEASV